MPQTYSFKCPEGHTFNAVAKLRARCPECGATARRNFSSLGTGTPNKSTAGEKIMDSSSNSSDKEEIHEDLEHGSKPPLISAPGDKSKLEKSTKPLARIVKQGRMPTKQEPKKVHVVTKRLATTHTVPSVSKPPTGSHQHKTEELNHGPYWHKVKKAYFG